MKTIEKVIRLCTVFGGSFEDIGYFYVFQLSLVGGGLYLSKTDDRYIREKCPYLFIFHYFSKKK